MCLGMFIVCLDDAFLCCFWKFALLSEPIFRPASIDEWFPGVPRFGAFLWSTWGDPVTPVMYLVQIRDPPHVTLWRRHCGRWRGLQKYFHQRLKNPSNTVNLWPVRSSPFLNALTISKQLADVFLDVED